MSHNVLIQKITNFVPNYVVINERVYTYNNDGYPISYIEYLNEDPIREVVFEYY